MYMNYIARDKYIKQIEKFIDKPIIKVLTGMRRVGKSTLLKIIKDNLLKEVSDSNKIYINFESISFSEIKNDKDLIEYLKPILNEERKKSNSKFYFFFDEIQLISNWEKVINGLRADVDCDIYITGSNSTLISGELATLLAGRYVQFEIYPFTFDEFIMIFDYLDMPVEDLFNEFIKLGGMPFIKYFNLDESVSLKYLSDVYNTVLVKDVLEYNNIRDVDIFNRILSYAMENVGHIFSANSIKNYFKNENRKVSVDTILNYLEYCNQAFILKKVPRYDIEGKKILKVDEKYYLNDHGFRGTKGFSNTKDIERVLENIVYIELVSRGYDVKIGKLKDQEIDFIAQKDLQTFYYQVSYIMSDESTRHREFGVYRDIKDNLPKYVLSMDKMNFSQDGIIHKNIIDFLLEIN